MREEMMAETGTPESRPPADGGAGAEGALWGRAPSEAAVRGAMIGLLGLLAITVAWWALALWPVEGVPPAWLERARAVCFNAGASGLPDASGWLLLVGQPIGMLAVLMVIAGDAVRTGVGRAFASPAGLLGVAGVVGVLLAGVVLAAVRVVGAPRDAEWLEAVSARVPASYPRLDRPLPEVTGTGRSARRSVRLGPCRGAAGAPHLRIRPLRDGMPHDGHGRARGPGPLPGRGTRHGRGGDYPGSVAG